MREWGYCEGWECKCHKVYMSNICQFALFFIIFTLINALTILMWLFFTKIFAQTNFNLINNVTQSLTYSLTYPLTHSLTHSLTHLLSYWPTHLRNDLLTHLLIYLWFIWYIIPAHILPLLKRFFILWRFQKWPSRGFLRKRCSENMQHIYRRTPMPKCHFNKAASNFIEIYS